MPVYRYKRTGLDIENVKKQVPPADAPSVSAGSIGPTQVWDITAPTTSLDDLNDYMSSRGWAYDSTDPSETPAEQSSGDVTHGDLDGVTSDQHHARQHALGAAADHTSATLAQLNALVSDATLDTSTASRPPSGAASGDLGGTYPSPTVNDGADSTAIHDNIAGEIVVVTEKAVPVGADVVLVEDSEDSNNKKRVQLSNLPVVQDAEDLVVSVRKDTTGTINAGQPVYLVGWDAGGSVPTVELADASSSATMPAFGVARSAITNLATGTVVASGQLTGLDTSSWSIGDDLYISETTGQLTATKPTGTALVQKIAQVTRDSPTMGVIQVFGAGRSNDLPNIPQNNVWLGNASGVPTETSRSGIDDTAIHDNVSAEISAITEKTTPVSADLLVIEDSAASNAKKRVQIGNLPSSEVFGTEYHYQEKTTEQTVSGTTAWVEYTSLTTGSLPAGTYRIGWMYVWKYSDTADDFYARLQVDNTTDLINPGGSTGDEQAHVQEPHDSSGIQRFVSSGFRHVTLGAGVHDIDLDFGCDDTVDTAYMYHGQIELWRVS